MKKHISLIILLSILVISQQTANAVLTNQVPTKHQNVNRTYNGSSSNTTKKSAPAITTAQKQKYYSDYLKYLEQTIKDMGCFTQTEMKNADITINLYFDSNYNVTKAYVSKYSHHDADIDHEAYNRKCKMCESKLYVTNFKPYDSKYADGQHSTKEFYITLKSPEAQKELSTKRFISTLKDDCWTPPYNSNNQYATVKVVLTFSKDYFGLKSYGIISSSGDDEYNTMVQAALRKWSQNIRSLLCDDFNHSNGDLTIYIKFSGEDIVPTTAPQNPSYNYSSSSPYSGKNNNSLKFPTFEDSIFGSGGSIFP